MAKAKKQNYMYGAAILAAGVVIMKILGAIYKIPLQHILGDVGYGYFNAAYSIYNVLLTVSTAGLPVALSRMISSANTAGRPLQVRRTFHVALCTLGGIGFLLSALMFFFPVEMAVFFVSKPAVSHSVYALSPAVLLVCLTSAFRGYIQGHGNMTPTTVGQVLEVLVKVAVGLALSLWLTRQGRSLPIAAAGAIFGVTAGSAAALIYMFLSCRRFYSGPPEPSEDVPDSVGDTFVSFVKIGAAITLGASVMSVFSLLDTKLIETYLPRVPGISEQLSDQLYGCYSTIMTLYNLPASFITPMTIAVVPAIAESVLKRDEAETGSIAESSLRVSAALAMPMGVGLAVLSVPIVGIIYPFTHAAGPRLLTLLGIASVFVCVSLVTNAILQASGHERFPILSMLAGGTVKVAANLSLLRLPSVNIFGAAIGTVLCYLVICLINCAYIYHILRVKPRYDRVFLRPLLSTAVMGATAWAMYGLLSRLLRVGLVPSRLPMLLALFASIASAVAVYAIMVVQTGSVTAADLKLIPKGEKIAAFLRMK